MFHHILVPLDGSTRAEQAIPVAAQIARATGGSVVLLQVNTVSTDSAWPALEAPFATPVDLTAEHKEITRYLMHLAALEVLEGIGIATVVVDGIPAQAILSVAQERQVDLIVLCSRGYSGFTRWRLGSVAQKVARHSPIPVLVLREGAGIPTNLHPEGLRPVRVMVPLDGSDLSEAVLSPAATLSAALSEPLAGQLHLVQVLSLPLMNHRYHSEQTVAARARIQADARTYLEAVQQRMQASGTAGSKLEVSTSLIVDEDVAGGLICAAEGEQQGQNAQEDYSLACDVIAMATHGRGGMERWVLGHTRLPLLILRPTQAGDQAQKEGATGRAKPSWRDRGHWLELGREFPSDAALHRAYAGRDDL